ncbi:hypothetical protein pb186bvf_000095 [Paramecium bursaria]
MTNQKEQVNNIFIIDCTQEYDEQELTQLLHLQIQDAYILLLGGKLITQIKAPLAFICTMFITITFFLYPETRKMPGDIIFFISLSDCILCFHWFTQALYYLQYDHSPYIDGFVCQAQAFLGIMAATGEFSYNVIFCMFLLAYVSKVLQDLNKKKWFFHGLAWTLMIGVPTSAYMLDFTGLNLFGTCSFKQKKGFPFAGILLVVLYMLISMFTIYKFKKSVPDDKKYLLQKDNVMKYYYKFVIVSTLIWSGLALCNLIVAFNCIQFHKKELDFFITIGNILKLCTPFFLSILRYFDPTIRVKVRNMFRRMSGHSKIEEKDNQDVSMNPLEDIQKNMKLDLLKSILLGITQVFDPAQQIGFSLQHRSTDLYQRNFSVDQTDYQNLQQTFGITQQDIDEEKIRDINIKDMNRESINTDLPMKMTSYAEKVFKTLLNRDSRMIDPYFSFQIEYNIEQINKSQGPDGGKGGEFIFFSFDNKLIIKTMSDEELKALRSRLGAYSLHLIQEESLISPIYGIFTFFHNKNYNILLMRNICQVPKQYIVRTFDIKGSQYQRQVLKNYVNQPKVIKQTLKDIDFLNLEGTIKVEDEYKYRIRKALERDSQFFGKARLMDYSLLVIKIDWGQYKYNEKVDEQNIQERFSSDLYRIKSTLEKGIYYHIGIIDYLQEWNAQKKIEREGKIFLKGKQVGVSAVEPGEYSRRFIEQVAYKLV